jgi:hypothetical protein
LKIGRPDGLGHVAAAQKIRMQRVCDPVLDGALCGGQCLAQHLPPEHLRAPDVAAVAAEDVVLDAFESEERDQILEYRVHRKGGMPAQDRPR